MFTDWLADWQTAAGMQAAKPVAAVAAPKTKKGNLKA